MSGYRIVSVDREGNPAIILRLDDNANIPVDPGNRDYQDFLAWQAAGGVLQQME